MDFIIQQISPQKAQDARSCIASDGAGICCWNSASVDSVALCESWLSHGGTEDTESGRWKVGGASRVSVGLWFRCAVGSVSLNRLLEPLDLGL